MGVPNMLGRPKRHQRGAAVPKTPAFCVTVPERACGADACCDAARTSERGKRGQELERRMDARGVAQKGVRAGVLTVPTPGSREYR